MACRWRIRGIVRWALNGATVAWAALCLAVGYLWIRSYDLPASPNGLERRRVDGGSVAFRRAGLHVEWLSGEGVLGVLWVRGFDIRPARAGNDPGKLTFAWPGGRSW